MSFLVQELSVSASRTDRRFARASAGESSSDAVAPELLAQSVAVRLVENAAWIQTTLTTVGRATNLGFAQAAVHIEGSGPIALGLARRLRGFGARVTLHSSDAVALLAASLDGFEIASDTTISPLALFVFATGEGVAFDVERLGSEGRTVVVVDAARPDSAAAVVAESAAAAPATGELRAGLGSVATPGREAVVLSIARLRDEEFDRASADIRAAFAAQIATHPAQPDPTASVVAADAALAKALLT